MVPSQPKAGDWFGEQRSSQKMAKKAKLPVVKSGDDARQAEVEKPCAFALFAWPRKLPIGTPFQ